MKSLAELQAIRDRAKANVALRKENPNAARVLVGMATCGIAAGARPVLNAFTEEIAKRGQVVSRYRAHLAEISGIGLNAEQEGVKPNYAYFPIRINASQFGASRDALYEALKEYGIFTRKYFYPITNSFACYEGRFDVHETPKALQISTEILTLPLYADLPLEDVDRICAAIKEIGQRKRS